MQNPDLVRLRHMLDAAHEACSFVLGKAQNDLVIDRMLLLSVVKDIEIIGEAANKVSTAVKLAHPDIPWQIIADMRNRLIHAYFDINTMIVWNTVMIDLPPLISALETIISNNDVNEPLT